MRSSRKRRRRIKAEGIGGDRYIEQITNLLGMMDNFRANLNKER